MRITLKYKNFSEKYNSDFLDIKTIENDHNIDAVVICSPTDTHIDLIKKFSNSGKAIFCEKPIDLDVNKTIECIDFLNKNKSQFMIGFNRRFDIHFKALKQHILEGKIGNIETVNIISRDPEPPTKDYISRSGGIFKDMTIHDFDMAIFLLGELPKEYLHLVQIFFTRIFKMNMILIQQVLFYQQNLENK